MVSAQSDENASSCSKSRSTRKDFVVSVRFTFRSAMGRSSSIPSCSKALIALVRDIFFGLIRTYRIWFAIIWSLSCCFSGRSASTDFALSLILLLERAAEIFVLDSSKASSTLMTSVDFSPSMMIPP
eukprot:Sdes_comp8556_c0_seq1m106